MRYRHEPALRVAAWIPAAVDAGAAAVVDQVRRGAVARLAAPGYAEMFERAGFGAVVALARIRPALGNCSPQYPTTWSERIVTAPRPPADGRRGDSFGRA